MEIWGPLGYLGFMFLSIPLLSRTSMAGVRSIGKIDPGFEGTQMNWIDVDGLFLLSNSSNFGFGFSTTQDVTKFLLSVVHMDSRRTIWTANRGSPVGNNDKFVFDKNGNVFLQRGDKQVWSTDTEEKGVASIELQDSGNLVLLASDSSMIWQSFSHPTDTLISNQSFVEGTKLVSDSTPDNLTFVLEIKRGDAVLSAAFKNPQPYWSLEKESRKIVNKEGVVSQAVLEANSWKFYDQNKALIWQFVFSDDTNANATWIAVLGKEGFISFYNLQDAGSSVASPNRIPQDSCSTPEPCGPYYMCSSPNNIKCQCPSVLSSRNCKPGIISACNDSKNPTEVINAGDGLSYFSLGFLTPSLKTDLNGCKASCLGNCSCLVMFFQNSSRNCFLLERVGSFQNSNEGSGFITYIKVSSNGGDNASAGTDKGRSSHFIAVIIAVSTVVVILGLLYVGFRLYKKKTLPESPQESSEEDTFLGNISGMPVRFNYNDLRTATNNFSAKLGQGGFGSVYLGFLADGTRVAVKKLEGIGQGKKEFRAEVSIIGSIHHFHLVRLKGFCAEGSHRLLVYEFMANGSLERWIFKRDGESSLLDWDTRYNIALGTAKGLAYLHEDCEVKIIHCDIKPENVLLDENFLAKVSDFGLAKLMTREQSHVFTTLRGTRGYLAPEWITNYAISEKSDVYSYGMLLLEIIGGRKNYDPNESSEKSHFPSYAFKMLEDGRIREILDSRLNMDDHDERVLMAIKVALWCIQEDMHSRPSMSKVVQMLDGLCDIPTPPPSSQLGFRLYSGFLKSISEEGTSSGPSDGNSDAHLSAVRLSGPR